MHFRIPVPGHALAGKCVHALGHWRVRWGNQSNGKNTVFGKIPHPAEYTVIPLKETITQVKIVHFFVVTGAHHSKK